MKKITALNKYLNGRFASAGSPDCLRNSFSFERFGIPERHMHYISYEAGIKFVNHINKTFTNGTNSSYVQFITQFAGASLYGSILHIFGERGALERSVDEANWKPLSLEEENLLYPYRNENEILIVAISCFEKKFDILAGINGLISLRFEEQLSNLSDVEFTYFTNDFELLIDKFWSGKPLSDMEIKDLESEIEKRYF